MRLPDFEEDFRRYVAAWVKAHPELAQGEETEIEDYLPEIYRAWEAAPSAAMGDAAPAEYFAGWDAQRLFGAAEEYFAGGRSLPQHLEQRLMELGKDGEEFLAGLLEKGEGDALQLVEMLCAMQSALPLAYYIETIRGRQREDELAEACAQGLAAMGEAAREPLKNALVGLENRHARECILDVLCQIGGEGVFDLVAAEFCAGGDRAFLAQLFSRLEDERAKQYLSRALLEEELGYLEYQSISAALETLGEIVEIGKDFGGDADYDTLSGL
jgi:hypothetical protein